MEERIEKLEKSVRCLATYVAYLEARSNKANYEIPGQFNTQVDTVREDILGDLSQ